MEEFLLRALLARDELNVVHQKNVDLAVFVLEFRCCAVVERLDKLVGEFLAVCEDYLHRRVVSFYLVAYGVEQMRLAEPRVAVDEQRVIRLAGVRRDRLRRRMGELV